MKTIRHARSNRGTAFKTMITSVPRRIIWVCLLAAAPLPLLHCAGQSKLNMVTYDQQLLGEAERAFGQKRFSDAAKLYAQIRDSYGKTQSASVAQYKLGLLYLFYDNPDADWKAALVEFKRFASSYPQDDRIDEVNSWIRVLVAMESFEAQFELNSARIRALKNRRNTASENTDAMMEALQHCIMEKDSLSRQVTKLENLIQVLEKTK
ncbi:MAG: outer membrane protein assembly factor BamD [Chitinivibrionales bacterium]|nr:outer membrane protein assembly factor BamD [Chitinivibrionales bacterium]